MEDNRQLKPFKKVKNGVEEVKKEFKEKTITLILGGFGIVAALAWNEAIKSLFDIYFQKSNAIIGKFIYAIFVTVIVVVVSLQLRRMSEKK